MRGPDHRGHRLRRSASGSPRRLAPRGRGARQLVARMRRRCSKTVAPDSFDLLRGDLNDQDVIERAWRSTSRTPAFIRPTWYTNASDYLDSPRNVDSLAATLRLALRLGTGGCKRFVGLGTCFEYDTSSTAPLTESARLEPGRLYSACKVGAWHALGQIGRLTQMAVAWARLFYLYGPREDPRRFVPSVVNALLEGRDAAVSPGGQVRDFLHVDDAASALWAVASSAVQGAINVASGEPVKVGDIARALGAIARREDLVKLGRLPYRPGDPMFVCADVRRLTDECGWTCHRFRLARRPASATRSIGGGRSLASPSVGAGGRNDHSRCPLCDGADLAVVRRA